MHTFWNIVVSLCDIAYDSPHSKPIFFCEYEISVSFFLLFYSNFPELSNFRPALGHLFRQKNTLCQEKKKCIRRKDKVNSIVGLTPNPISVSRIQLVISPSPVIDNIVIWDFNGNRKRGKNEIENVRKIKSEIYSSGCNLKKIL